MKRSEIYSVYKKLKKETSKNILKQQLFLKLYVKENYNKIDKLLIYHGIGTGKTCSSILIAEEIMKMDKKMRILVILPARLKTNYIDELISEECIKNKYISEEERNELKKEEKTLKEKKEIRKKYMEKIKEKYEIISYENLRKQLLDSKDYKKTIEEITKNRVIIIDEVHNLITSNIEESTINKILKLKEINEKTISKNALILRLLTKLGDKTSKFFLMTATPIYDNYGQFIQLVYNLIPNADKTKITNLKYLINILKGKISYYDFKDKSILPKVKINNMRIKMSNTQMKEIEKLDEKNKKIESNVFCIKERQKAISVYDRSKKEIIFTNLKEYAPKLNKLFKLLKLKGKHVIYSTFIEYSLYLIADYLEKEGWNNYIKSGSKEYKTFVIWDGKLKDNQKQEIKSILNDQKNIDGKIIRIILGSPSIKEGITFKHIQHLHQIDPVWNSSAKDQIEGRVIRYKSHEEIKENDPILKREVTIHNYIGVSNKKGYKICDEKIYDEIIIKKMKVIKTIEKLLKEVSLDYYIWNDKAKKKGKEESEISVSSAEKKIKRLLIIPKEKKIIEKSSCPIKRRPIKNICKDRKYPYLHRNNKGYLCCYKKYQKKLKS